MKTKCSHIWVRVSRNGKEITKECKKCHEKKTSKMTPYEKRQYKKMMENLFSPSPMHKVWYDFQKKFGSANDGSWKYKDKWKMMCAVGRWAKKYPKDVYICNIDDSVHAGSDIVFILHRTSPRRIWGVTVIVITQCDDQKPFEYFMYPSHMVRIVEAMIGFSKMIKKEDVDCLSVGAPKFKRAMVANARRR